jgi:hypothetical protein
MMISPEETRNALRKLPKEALDRTEVVGNWKLKLQDWQLEGIVWEHDMLIQYNWDGAPCYNVERAFDRRTRDLLSNKGKESECTAFCGVEFAFKELRTLVELASLTNSMRPEMMLSTITLQKLSTKRVLRLGSPTDLHPINWSIQN